MKGLTDLMKQAQSMQKSIEAAQQDLIAKEVAGVALAGMIKVVINGRYNCKRVEIADDLLKQPKMVIQDAIAAAFNDAANKIEDYSKSKMSGLMAGMDLPTDLGSLTDE
jgi:DNA-binding YbaB/EbfC family protein